MKKVTLLAASVLCIACFLSSCRTNVRQEDRLLSAEVVFPEVDLYDLISVSDTTVLGNSYSDTLLCKLFRWSQVDGLVLAKQFFRKGKAESEELFPVFAMRGSQLYAMECQGVSNKFIVVDPYESGVNPMSNARIQDLSWLNGYSPFMGYYPLEESVFFALSGKDGSDNLLFLIDNKERQVTPIGLQFDDGYPQVDLIKRIIYRRNAAIYYNETNGKFAYTCGEGQLFEIYDYRNGQLLNRNRVLEIFPKYQAETVNGRPNFTLLDTEHRGVKSSFTDTRIYLSYSNPTDLEEYKGNPGYFMDYLDEFDWDGNFIARYQIDKPFSTFKVSAGGRFLFTLSLDKSTAETELRRYRLQ